MKAFKVFTFLFFGCLSFFSSFPAFAEKWPIKKFKIVEKIVENTTDLGPLSVPADFDETVANLQNYLSEEQELEIENWLQQVAYYFESLGFDPPRYEAKSFNEEYFEVYVYPFGKKNEASAEALDDCTAKNKIETHIRVDPHRSFKNGKLTSKAHQDLAHELFHTVQYGYPMFNKPCQNGVAQGYWIVEGTAEAVGIDTARVLKKIQPLRCQIGMRDYSKRLYAKTKSSEWEKEPCKVSRSYQTQSFWQYLGEYSVNGRPLPDKFIPPDYRYLHDFFNTKHNSVHWKHEYAWLNKALLDNKRFGFGLSRAYPGFVGTFSAYWRRLPLYKDVTITSEAQKKWLKYVFGGCYERPLEKTTIPITLSTEELDPVSAHCIDIEFKETGKMFFTITAEYSNEGKGKGLLDLAISAADGEERKQPIIDLDGELPYKASFTFDENVNAGDHKVYIISNVANKPQNSIKHTPIFKLIFNTATANIREPKTKSSAESEQGSLEQQDSGKKLAKAQLEQGIKTENWHVQAQRFDRASCENAFQDRVCGPHTRISIQLGEDAGGIMREAVQPTMSLERTINVMGAIDEIGVENVTENIIEAQQDVINEYGAGINLVIPKIEYGFTGSFNNALISVSKSHLEQSKGGYKSVGPGWVGGCDPDGYHPFSGKVTIEEASHQVLRGSYSANLVDTEDITNCESAPISKHISGTFSLPNPRIGKDEPEGVLSEDIVDHSIQQINELMPGMYTGELGKKARDVAKQKIKEKEARKTAKQKESKSASIDLVCECTCNTASTMLDNNPECFRQCLPTYQNCENLEQIISKSKYIRPPKEQEIEQISKLREEFEVLLENKFPTLEMQNMMLKGFDDLPNLSTKQELVDQFKTKPQ